MGNSGSRLIWWRLKLEEYDYEIIHKAGKRNTNADTLSRNPITLDSQLNIVARDEREEEIKREYQKKSQILYEYHDAPTGEHQGVARTLNRIKLLHN
ncbi:hypothetical protein P5V15_001371 [Pogonomyrmex californicus]